MKTLIVFSTKTGTTEECAQLLAQHLGKKETDLVDLKVQKIPDLEPYDCIVLGSRVRYGKVGKQLRNFASLNKQTLLTKKLGIFLCMAIEEDLEKTLKKSFGKKIRAHALVQESFGGTLNLSKMKRADKKLAMVILSAFSSQKQEPPQVHTERVERFAEILLK